MPPADRVLLTITPNPSLDLLFETDALVFDDANRMADPRRRPGGQGINVARAARALGSSATAIALLGGVTGREIEDALLREGTDVISVPAEGETRTFVAVRTRGDGRSLLLNARGPVRSPEDAARLLQAAADAVDRLRPRWVACCGSLPQGFPQGFYAEVARLARAAGARVVVDCDGDALRAAADLCDLLVPNEHEAARLAGTAVASITDAARVAVRLARTHASMVAITLGARGAVLSADGRCWHAAAPGAPPGGSAVGAGDAFLAALVTALAAGRAGPDALAHAVAAGTATLGSVGADLLRPADMLPAGVEVEELAVPADASQGG